MENENQVTLISIQQDVNKLTQTIEKLTQTIEKLTQVCSRMDNSASSMQNHIHFVEGTYETLRSPLNFITNRINTLRGVEQNELPYRDARDGTPTSSQFLDY